MARRATELYPHPFASMIRQAWKDSGLTIEEVTFRYKTEAIRRGFSKEDGTLKGGTAVKRWCYGWSMPQLHQYDVLADILNPILRETHPESVLPSLTPGGTGTGYFPQIPSNLRRRSPRVRNARTELADSVAA